MNECIISVIDFYWEIFFSSRIYFLTKLAANNDTNSSESASEVSFPLVASTQLQKLIRNWPTKRGGILFDIQFRLDFVCPPGKSSINFRHSLSSSMPEIQIPSPWSFHFYDTCKKTVTDAATIPSENRTSFLRYRVGS